MFVSLWVGFWHVGRVFHGPLLFFRSWAELAAVMERTSNNAAQRYPHYHLPLSGSMLADASLDLLWLPRQPNHFEVAARFSSRQKPHRGQAHCTTSAE